jgi:hypothetical protein
MDSEKQRSENQQNEEERPSIKAFIFFGLFVFLIAGGIITKRIFGHPEWMTAWHLPAAVFLVLSGYEFMIPLKKQYEKDRAEALKRIRF